MLGRLSFPAKIALRYAVSASLLIGALILFGFWQAETQDQGEIAYTRTAIISAIDAKAKHFQSWLNGYALWDEFYSHMVQSTDTDWTDQNVGPGVWKSFTMPMKGVYVSDAADHILYHYWDGGKAPKLSDFEDVDLRSLRRGADQSDKPQVKTILYDSQPYFLGFSRIRGTKGTLANDTDPPRYLTWLQPVGGTLLADIGKSMAISNLRWAQNCTGEMPYLNLFPGRTLSECITWHPRRPGTAMLHNGLLPLFVLALFTCIIGVGQYLSARRLNMLLQEKQREAETQFEVSQKASEQSALAEKEARELVLRLREQEQRVARLSEERERYLEHRKQESRDQSLATLLMFEQDFNSVLEPMTNIAGLLNHQSAQLQDEAEAGHRATAIVANFALHSTEAIDIVVDGNRALTEATSRLDGNVSAAVSSTLNAQQAIDDLVKRLADLSANAVTVETVVSSVADIATRTNRLALNARIEAARAGESGHGFAVVANEVRQMAELTSQATASITAVLQMMQDSTRTATSGIYDVRKMVDDIAVVTNSSRSALDHQSLVADEINQAVIGAKKQIMKTDDAIRKLESVVGSSQLMAKAVTAAASELRERGAQLQVRAGQFAEALRGEGKP